MRITAQAHSAEVIIARVQNERGRIDELCGRKG